ncbi:MAG: YkgJ family cysteine cluster protein [Candidatus Thorarchaeota archaeon]|jgi:Fe-S-cluster containining protein
MIERKTKHTCKRCGKCCHKFAITFSLEEISREPRLMRSDAFMEWMSVPSQNRHTYEFMRQRNHPFILRKPYRNAPCPFLFPNKECMIYETRPQVCRDFPGGSLCIREYEDAKNHNRRNNRCSARQLQRR